MPDQVRYSPVIEGDAGNYDWHVRFDWNSCGYLGITQLPEERGSAQRVLLSRQQVDALRHFLRRVVPDA
jgi:hypothetical protein